MVDESKAGVHPDFKKKSSTGMESQIAVLIAYLFGWVSGLIIYLIEKENKFVKYHAMQALILGIFEVACIIVISVILGLIPYIGWFLFSWLGYVLASVAWIFGIIAIIKAFKGEVYRIPVISKLADKYIKY